MTSKIVVPSGSFSIGFNYETCDQNVQLFSIGEVIGCSYADGQIHVVFNTDWDKGLSFTLSYILNNESNVGTHEVKVYWIGYACRLYVNGTLIDEDWPLGDFARGEADLTLSENVTGFIIEEVTVIPEEQEMEFTGPMQFFTPPGLNTGVGDCMPFARDGRYCLYYLLDRRGHRSKAGLGAHQWAQISSSDLKTWTIHPIAVPITEQWEGSICTGSLIEANGLIYAFYAARMSDQSPARLTCAVSKDGIHFEKTNEYISLKEPYEPVSARDPMVFFGADGKYHMLVTTNLLTEAAERTGCLAHLVSTDLKDWQQLEPFIVPGYKDQPECSDYFEWNGWYYLVISNYATARYRYSKNPFGPWIKPAYDILDTYEGQVAKTAAFKNRRFSSSFLTPYPRSYAGYAITHELIQNPDGTLGVRFLDEILPEDKALIFEGTNTELSAGEGFKALYLGEADNLRLRVQVQPGDASMLMGIELKDEDGQVYQIEVNPAMHCVNFTRPKQTFNMNDARNQLLDLQSVGGAYTIDLIVKDEALDFMICNRVHTMRVPRNGKLTISLYSMWGSLKISEIKLTSI